MTIGIKILTFELCIAIGGLQAAQKPASF